MSIAHIISHSGVMSIILNGKQYTVQPSHSQYDSIKEALVAKDEKKLLRFLDLGHTVNKWLSQSTGTVRVDGGIVYYKDKPLHNNLTTRILTLMDGGFPVDPMIRFLENLMQNPSSRSVMELFDFLDHRALPITEDGCFLAYKGVRSDWYDRYSGKILNKLGNVIEIERNEVDDERSRTCSHGLHVGTIEYVRGYCTEKILIVKVNPRDCVSVPLDHNAQKLRTCRYEVLSLYEEDLESPVYSSKGGDYEWDYPEDDYDYDEYYDEEDDGEDMYLDSDLEDYHSWETQDVTYGVKPDGSPFYNKRDSSGRFTKK